MNHHLSNLIFVLLFFTFTIPSVFAQKPNASSLIWKHKMDFESDELSFIGSHKNQVYFYKPNKKSSFQNYNKSPEAQEIISCNMETNECQKHKINIVQKNWFSSFVIHGGKIFAFVSAFDKKAKKANFWSASFHLENMEEAMPWKLLGKTACNVKLIIWKRNQFLLKKSGNTSADGSVAIAFYNNGTLGGSGGKTVGQTDGLVLTISKEGEITKKEKYDFVKGNESKWGKKKLHQIFITDDNSVHLLHQHQQLTKKKIPRMDKGRLSIASFNVNDTKEKTIVVGGDEKIYLDGLLSLDKNQNLKLCSIVVEKLGKKRKLKSYFNLSKINEDRTVSEISNFELNNEDEFYHNIYFPTVVHYSSQLLKIDDSNSILFFGNRMITKDRNSSNGFSRNYSSASTWSESPERLRAVQVDMTQGKIDWVSHPIDLSTSISSAIKFKQDDFLHIFDSDAQYHIMANGAVKKVKSFPKKSKKFKKKILVSPEHGYIKKGNSFLILGMDKKDKLYIGEM